MTIKSSCYLQIARRLAVAPMPPALEEAGFRTVISRSYYSCLHEAKLLLVRMRIDASHGSTAQGSGSHERVFKALKDAVHMVRHFDKSILKDAYQELLDLRKLRNQADYDIQETVDRNDMDDFLYRAEGVFKILENLPRK